VSYFYNYTGGTVFWNGVAAVNEDLWFREGVVVPEPAAVALGFVGAGLLALAHWGRRRRAAR
jgi:hypothetical protein